jgi:hypothetical protein
MKITKRTQFSANVNSLNAENCHRLSGPANFALPRETLGPINKMTKQSQFGANINSLNAKNCHRHSGAANFAPSRETLGTTKKMTKQSQFHNMTGTDPCRVAT